MDIFKSYYTTQRKEEITFRLSASSVYTTPKLSFGTSYLQGEKHNMVSKVRVYVPNVISGIFFAMFSSNNTRSVSVDLDFGNLNIFYVILFLVTDLRVRISQPFWLCLRTHRHGYWSEERQHGSGHS